MQFDGNNNDQDDINALPVSALLADAADIEGKTTFFYNNNLAEWNSDWQVSQMRKAGSYAEKLGIDTVDYQNNIADATNKLVDIFNSGQKVLSIEAGPMEAVYRALEQTSPENRKNITLLSHSWWNENQDVINRDGVSEARTWSDLKSHFGEVNFVQISDQNAGFYNDAWKWLSWQSDSVYTEAWDLMETSGKPTDASDAGMLYYALTGNEYANPWDAKSFLDQNTPEFGYSNNNVSNWTTDSNFVADSYFIEAEDMNLSGSYHTEYNSVASGNEVISLIGGGNNDVGYASFNTNDISGHYKVVINTFDENDGTGKINVEQNGQQIGSFVLDGTFGSNIADAQSSTSLELHDIYVSSGDTFKLTGFENGSEYTAEHMRIDSVEFVPIDM